jgi:hypothetical protein
MDPRMERAVRPQDEIGLRQFFAFVAFSIRRASTDQ